MKKINRERAGFIQVIAVLLLLVVLFVCVVIALPKNEPIVKAEASINPQEFKVAQSSTLALKLMSNDDSNSLNVKLRLVTNNLVHIFLGDFELPQEQPNSGNYVNDITLQPAQKTEQPYSVKVNSLPQGIASQKFSITVEAYVSGNMVTSCEVTFTVDK